jgi:hypothetical protein
MQPVIKSETSIQCNNIFTYIYIYIYLYAILYIRVTTFLEV